MGVQVDDAWRQRQAAGIDDCCGVLADIADCSNAVIKATVFFLFLSKIFDLIIKCFAVNL